MNISISICPTSLEFDNGDRYDETSLLAAIRTYIEKQHPGADVTCLQIGHRQGDEWARVDGDSEVGLDLLESFFADRGDDKDLYVQPVLVEVATADETIRIFGGIEDFAGLEHPAISDACEAYHREATRFLDGVGGRLHPCQPRGSRRMHSVWAGSQWGYSCGAIGTTAADLTDAEKTAIGEANDAGLEAAKQAIGRA
jgi:hypothetical protein